MPRGPKKHLKRLNAPKHWMLDKIGGVFAPKPSQGPHKQSECLPIIIFLRNRLKYALTYDEVKRIVYQRCIKIDGKIRTDMCYPSGYMDVISIEKTNEYFRLLYDSRGRFVVHRISKEESEYKLCRVKKVCVGLDNVPYITTHDGRTIRYPNPDIKVHDSVVFNLVTGKIIDFIKFDSGNIAMVTGGHNTGRVGLITHREKHPGSFDIVHLKDATGHAYATRLQNVFVIGKGSKPLVTIPKDKGIRLTNAEDRAKRIQNYVKSKAGIRS